MTDTTMNTGAAILSDDLNPEIVKATAQFIGKITGLVPPPNDAFPPEWHDYLRVFTKRLCEIAGMNATSAVHASAAPSELREAARQFHNLTQGDSAVIIRAPSAEKRDAIVAAGERLRAAIAAGGAKEAVAWLVEWQGKDQFSGETWVHAHANEPTARDQARAHGGTCTPLYASPLPRVAATEKLMSDDEIARFFHAIYGTRGFPITVYGARELVHGLQHWLAAPAAASSGER